METRCMQKGEMEIVEKGVIPKPVHDERFNSITFPCIEKLPSGRWLVSFKASKTKEDNDSTYCMLMRSDDEGKTWSDPFEPIPLPKEIKVPGQYRAGYPLSLGGNRVLMVLNWTDASNLSLPYYDEETETLKDTKIYYSFSEDGGETWCEPFLMKVLPDNEPVPLTGPPFRLKDGTLVCHFEVNKAVGDPSKWVHRSAMIFSKNQGRTWGNTVIVTNVQDMYYWDQRPNVLADGKSIVDYFRTLDGKKKRYLNIHSKISLDGGRTWSEFTDTGIYGQPGIPASLPDGRLFTIDIDRSLNPVITVRCYPGYGKPCKESLIVLDYRITGQDSKNVSMQDAWKEMYRFSVGHPSLLRLNDSELLAYWYAGKNHNNTRIEYARIKCRPLRREEILL